MDDFLETEVIETNAARRQIFCFSQIDAWSSEFIIRQLLELDRASNDEITMFINSPGGSVTQMFAIIDTMSVIKSPVRTIVIGSAASAAACIASVGKTRLIYPTAQVMIHEASAAAYGDMSSMKESIEQMQKQNDLMLAVLAKSTNKTIQFIKETVSKTDKYFTAQEAVSFGIMDRIITDGEAQSLKLSEGINVEGYEIKNKEVQILRTGTFFHPIYGKLTITEESLSLLKSNFDNNVRGVDISIDFTHDNESGEKPAAFWIKSLEIKANSDGKGKGLFAKGEFTLKGAELVSGKEYRYSSADFCIDYVDQNGKHHPYVLRGGTLTNRPFIKNMNPIQFSEGKHAKKEIKKMDQAELIAALKLSGIDVTAAQSQLTEMTAKVTSLENQIRELSALPAKHENEVSALKAKLAEASAKIIDAEKTRVFNALVAEGKVAPAQKETVLKTFACGDDIAAFYKDAPAVIATKAKGSGDEATDDILTEAESILVQNGTYSKDEIIKNRKINR